MMFNWFKKKPAPVKKLRPVRIAVHCAGNVTIVHYAVYRTLRADGGLTLHDATNCSEVVADYASGVWLSVTIGTRKVSMK